MKTHLFSYRTKKIAVVLFVSLFALWNTHLNAQDTIFCPNDKYYWNGEPCNGGYFSHTAWDGSAEYYYNLTDKELTRPAILKEIVFPKGSETYIYGIAGTTIGCNNPKGCYFYLCKKINDQFVILDSAAWSHKTDYDYIDYCNNVTNVDTSCNQKFMYIQQYNDIVTNDGIPAFDTINNSFPIFEAYFTNPIAVADTFYIGMNSNGVLAPMYYSDNPSLLPNDSYRRNYSLLVTRTSPIAIPNVIYCSWIHAPFDNANRKEWEQNIYFNGFFPILEAHSCPQVVEISADSLTYNSAYIAWNLPYASSFFRLEYGKEGFVQGNGTIIDNINATNITLNNLEPNTRYIAYIQSHCISNDTSSSWTSISFQTLDTTCAVVENLDTIYVQDVRARIRWDITSDEVLFCQMEWGESGFEQGSGNFKNNIYDTTYFFQNLAAGTTYDVYVRTYCQRSGIYSDWQKLTFTTDANSIDEAENQLPISVNPNPTTGMVEVTLPQGYENQTVEVYDVQGKLLQSQRLQNGKATFNLSEYPNGVYVIKVGNASCRVVKSK